MPTEAWFEANPKVSAYIPKQLNERLKLFKKEQSLSVSQAVTTILSNYFGLDQQVNQFNLGDINSERLQELEQRVTMLSQSVDQRLRNMEEEFTKLRSSLVVDQSKLITEISSPTSELLSELQKEQQDRETVLPNALLSKPINRSDIGDTQLEWHEINTVLLDKPQSKLLKKEPEKELNSDPEPSEELEPNDETIPGIEILSGAQLAKRLKAHHSVVARYKSGKRKQSLTEWSKSVDPDGVAWEYSEEQKKYFPLSQGKPNLSLQGELLKADSDESD